MTKDELRAIRTRCEAATTGPWEYDGMHNEIHTYNAGVPFLIISELRSHPGEKLLDNLGHTYNADFDFIANARRDIPALLEYIEDIEMRLQNQLQGVAE